MWQAGWWRVGCGALRTGCPCYTPFLFLCFLSPHTLLPSSHQSQPFLIRVISISIIFFSFFYSSNYFQIYLDSTLHHHLNHFIQTFQQIILSEEAVLNKNIFIKSRFTNIRYDPKLKKYLIDTKSTLKNHITFYFNH